jgi:hypothetical protein
MGSPSVAKKMNNGPNTTCSDSKKNEAHVDLELGLGGQEQKPRCDKAKGKKMCAVACMFLTVCVVLVGFIIYFSSTESSGSVSGLTTQARGRLNKQKRKRDQQEEERLKKKRQEQFNKAPAVLDLTSRRTSGALNRNTYSQYPLWGGRWRCAGRR